MVPLILAPLIAKLTEAGLGLIGNAVINKGKEFVEQKLGVSLDAAVDTEEGRIKLVQLQNDHEEELLKYALEDRKIDTQIFASEVQDAGSAREMQMKVATSVDAGWLNRNIVSILALIVVLGGGYILHISQEADVRMGVASLITLVLGFFYGKTHYGNTSTTTITGAGK